jgi:glycosyltransferase involved in cell wall biosynthesis
MSTSTTTGTGQHHLDSTKSLLFSVIIGVYNDWTPLNECLRSLERQTKGPSFEVIIVDDGSAEPAPGFIRDWSRYFTLVLDRQSHAGVSAARNRGARISKGPILVFADADSRFQRNCLEALASTITESSQHNSFQLRLTGDCSTLIGRVEELRLITLQNHLLQPNGCIRYLNTAGFATRRTHLDIEAGVFDTVALRAEDTLLLADLIERGELPLFVPSAIVQHETPFSLMECLRKDIRSAYLELGTYDIIASKGVKFRVTHPERLRMLQSMWKTAGQPSIGRSAWFVLAARQVLRLALHFAYRVFGTRRSTGRMEKT